MNYETFLNKCQEALYDWPNLFFEFDRYFVPDRSKPKSDPMLECKWVVGGMTGGSCWGGELYPCSVEPEPEFEQLDKLLEALCPQITFLQYKRLCQDVIATSTNCRNDYYGNYTEYAVKQVYLRRLYEALVDKHLLPHE